RLPCVAASSGCSTLRNRTGPEHDRFLGAGGIPAPGCPLASRGRCGLCPPGRKLPPSRNTVRLEPCCASRRGGDRHIGLNASPRPVHGRGATRLGGVAGPTRSPPWSATL